MTTREGLEGVLMGLLTGDGHFQARPGRRDRAVVDFVHDPRSPWSDPPEELLPLLHQTINTVLHGTNYPSIAGPPMKRYYSVRSAALANIRTYSTMLAVHLQERWEFDRTTKLLPPAAILENADARRGFVRALWFCDGTARFDPATRHYALAFSQSALPVVEVVEAALSIEGIAFNRTVDARSAEVTITDRSGRSHVARPKPRFRVSIHGGRQVFEDAIGIWGIRKARALREMNRVLPPPFQNCRTTGVKVPIEKGQLTDDAVAAVKAVLAGGGTYGLAQRLAAHFGVRTRTVNRIASGAYWGHIEPSTSVSPEVEALRFHRRGCSHNGCAGEHVALGLCESHYRAARREARSV